MPVQALEPCQPAGVSVSAVKQGKETRMREVLEAWNLADWEVWRFVRAWNARVENEREEWAEAVEGRSVLGGLLS